MNEHEVLQDIRRYLAMVHKRRGIAITCLSVSLIVAVLYNYTTRPVYQAAAQILIDRDFLTSPPEDLARTQVLLTVVGGKVVYRK